MKKFKSLIISTAIAGLLNTVPSVAMAQNQSGATELEQAFKNPADQAKPWVYWFWMNGNLSKEGITADLEAMSRVGIGGALIMEVNFRTPAGKYAYLSDEWRELFKFAMSEAKRLKLKIIKNNDAGWTGSGGPWVTPDKSMQQLTFSEMVVEGGGKFDLSLPMPPHNLNHYQDIAVFAVPAKPALPTKLLEITTSGITYPGASLIDNKFAKAVTANDIKTKKHWILFDYKQPVEIQAMTIVPKIQSRGEVFGELLVSNDNKNFTKVKDFYIAHKSEREALTFAPVTARYFRINLRGQGLDPQPKKPKFNFWKVEDFPEVHLHISEILFHNTPRLDSWDEKALFVYSNAKAPEFGQTNKAPEFINITQHLTQDGRLQVSLPKGYWNILRIGHTSSGQKNNPPPKAGEGLEISKLNPQKLKFHFDNLIGKLVKDVGPLAGDTLMGTHIDSWEVKFDNWDDTLPAEFKQRTGYDMIPFLPATVGHIVKSEEITERFLWDLRRVMADVVADNYYGKMRTLAAEHGMQLSSEAYLYGPLDSLQAAGRTDIPMNEFWTTDDGYEKPGYSARQAASAAHTYGKKIVAAEAFTAVPFSASWSNHPYTLKGLGDRMFARGTNRLVFHRWAMQPWTDRWPGITFGPYGFNYERTLTWFEQSKAWLTYLSRSQALLQSGQFQADYAVFVGESAPYDIASFHDKVKVKGYNYDYLNQEIIRQLQFKDGQLVLPTGMQYKLLVLKNSSVMTEKTIKKLAELVKQGAVILGEKPQGSPTLVNYPQSDVNVQNIANKLWANYQQGQAGSNTYGKGKVFWHTDISQVIQQLNLTPDVAFNQAGQNIEWLHRQTKDADVYFLSLFKAQAKGVEATFRISGRQPEFWDAYTGDIVKPAKWRANDNGTTTVFFDLEPSGSIFVVFPKHNHKIAHAQGGEKPPVVSVQPQTGIKTIIKGTDHKTSVTAQIFKSGSYQINLAEGQQQTPVSTTINAKVPAPININTPWQLSFPNQFAYKQQLPQTQTVKTLKSWPEFNDNKVKYFSGTGVYTTTFTIDSFSKEQKHLLDLGNVQVIAEVIVNGVELATLWKPPYRVDVSEVLKPGKNQLEVRVTNLWINRMIGDAAYPDLFERTPMGGSKGFPDWLLNGEPVPETGRTTFSTYHPYQINDPLQPSGLIGPVKLIPYIEQTLLSSKTHNTNNR
ncbi:glycoside hydrolase [Catenovulum agarivorans DS-2]|uniref:Glycoside hydrolase n=1 Tax=Catenovulum agarivorans DS-2 TaxID=1328313 RepID=W7QYP1_9ALTE|nr:glycosyl hydrolase [Catenovulum agarivorans]EWH10505.1 glycoside hydrolase [Catenovulum agarivorans DS-2]